MTSADQMRQHLIEAGITSADQIEVKHLGKFPERNRQIIADAIFGGMTLREAAQRAGLSHERARSVMIRCSRKAAEMVRVRSDGGWWIYVSKHQA